MLLAEWTGLEPATPGVTGRYSNQLNYHSMRLLALLQVLFSTRKNRTTSATNLPDCQPPQVGLLWRPLGDSNPCNHRERVVS